MDLSLLFYKVAPLSTNSPGPHPALILLHGRGTDENDLLGLVPSLDPRLLIISVRAPYEFSYGGYTWFNLEEQGDVKVDEILSSREALILCLDDIQKKYPVDQKRLFLFGFSMGAMMSLTVSLSYPDRFKGVVAHSGLLLQDEKLLYRWNDLGGISFLIEHGTHDPVVPVELGRQAHQRLVDAKAHVLYKEYSIQHTISEESLNDFVVWLNQQI
jgi:phospholipase/carboxylesterase